MNTLDAGPVLLTCGDHHGSRALAALPTVILPSCPGRADLDPVLRELTARRLVVAGTDADLAAVLGRLLRRERLDVEVAYLPRGRSAAARAWGLPRDAEALALDGVAAPVPLVRDDSGGVLVGRAEARLRGEVYCDETLVLRGAGRVVVEAGPRGVGVRASRTGRAPDGRTRAVPPRESSLPFCQRTTAPGARATQPMSAQPKPDISTNIIPIYDASMRDSKTTQAASNRAKEKEKEKDKEQLETIDEDGWLKLAGAA